MIERALSRSGRSGRLIGAAAVAALTLILCAPHGPRDARVQAVQANQLPAWHVIADVPFVGWSEAARLAYFNKDVVSPSTAACVAMLLTYWGQDLSIIGDASRALPRTPGGWAVAHTRSAASLDELKPYIAGGMPIVVVPALTPYAHTPRQAALAYAVETRSVELADVPQSLVLGPMHSLDTMARLVELKQIAWDSLLNADRLLLGYDDNRRVVILHDPSLGPAQEIGYDDFERMWGARGRGYLLVQPTSAERPRASAAATYPAPTPDQQAAGHWVRGLALGAVGRTAEASAELLDGLAVPEIGRGYQHLLHFEMAIRRAVAGDRVGATTHARAAADLLPEHHRPWQLLAQLHRASGEGSAADADAAEAKAEAMGRCSEAARVTDRVETRLLPPDAYTEAQRVVAQVLAQDFFIFAGCESSVAWLLGPPLQP